MIVRSVSINQRFDMASGPAVGRVEVGFFFSPPLAPGVLLPLPRLLPCAAEPLPLPRCDVCGELVPPAPAAAPAADRLAELAHALMAQEREEWGDAACDDN